jgi:hypothetical protein
MTMQATPLFGLATAHGCHPLVEGSLMSHPSLGWSSFLAWMDNTCLFLSFFSF